jgi:hypothetical protein
MFHIYLSYLTIDKTFKMMHCLTGIFVYIIRMKNKHLPLTKNSPIWSSRNKDAPIITSKILLLKLRVEYLLYFLFR